MEAKLARISDISLNEFDFVIVGSGVAGCVLASRLSENPNTSVALLEAGDAHFNDPLILNPDGWPKQVFDDNYDWAFLTAPQSKAMFKMAPNMKPAKSFYWSRGKGLGGSSCMNFLYWTRPQREEIESIEKLGNPGWTWERFFEASKKSETFRTTQYTNRPDYLSDYEPTSVGHKGPISISFPMTVSGAEVAFYKAMEAHGVEMKKDGLSGSLTGTFKSVSNIDPETGTRSTAATGYLIPALGRPNLKVLTKAYVRRIITADGAGDAVASGVEFEYEGEVHVVNVNKDVIVSASTVKSPQILELSGIGDRSILEPLGIPVRVDLPAVGTNLQDHLVVTGSICEMKLGKNFVTSDTILRPEIKTMLQELYGGFAGPLALACCGCTFLPLQTFSDRADELIAGFESRLASADHDLSPGLRTQYKLLLEQLKDKGLSDLEIVVFPFNLQATGAETPYVGLFPSIGHPISRGTIHVASSDPKVQPTIDPNYFADELDLEILVDSMKFIRKVTQEDVWKDVCAGELLPGPQVVTDEQLREHVRENLSTTWHACGTCPMAPKDQGGVVDTSLKVYGTKNIRVVDLSVLPLLTAVHTQATTYGIAEQAADIIKAEHRL
ncbi:GMC oxidoreductase [Daedaleopsis nitida]|nr:GMC oxidoreductase [Daedaleopsis nitida]